MRSDFQSQNVSTGCCRICRSLMKSFEAPRRILHARRAMDQPYHSAKERHDERKSRKDICTPGARRRGSGRVCRLSEDAGSDLAACIQSGKDQKRSRSTFRGFGRATSSEIEYGSGQEGQDAAGYRYRRGNLSFARNSQHDRLRRPRE